MAEIEESLHTDYTTGTFKIIQDKDEFCYGTDALALGRFANIRRGDNVCDLCSGNGIVALLVAMKKDDAKITTVEIQKHAAEIAGKNVILNNLQNRMKVINGDLKEVFSFCKKNTFNVVTCNPPYEKIGTQKKNELESKAIARHELCCTLADVCSAAAGLLNSNGRFYMVHRAYRSTEIFVELSNVGLQVKRLKYIFPRKGENANLVLVEAVKGGAPGCVVEEPEYIYG